MAGCSQCGRDLDSRPNDMCTAPYHWHTYAEWLEKQISAMADALPRCEPYGGGECGRLATIESYDAAGDPFPTCEEHAVCKSDWAGPGFDTFTPYRWASSMTQLLGAIRVSTSGAGTGAAPNVDGK